MSRGYRVMVEPLVQATRNVSASDEVCIQIALLPILGESRMRELVKDALRQDGWTDDGQGGLTRSMGDGLKATLDKDGSTVTVTQTQSQTVTGASRNANEAARLAEENAARAKDSVKRAATTALGRVEGDVRAALDAAVQRVYVTALEEKARSLGQLQSMERIEGADGTVEVVLKVRT
jgi:hypothetical protein